MSKRTMHHGHEPFGHWLLRWVVMGVAAAIALTVAAAALAAMPWFQQAIFWVIHQMP